jgi:ribonuclease HI
MVDKGRTSKKTKSMSSKKSKPNKSKKVKDMRIKFKYKFIDVFTDGSFVKNKYGGIGVFFGKNDSRNLSKNMTKLTKLTSPRMEIYAIIYALKIIYDSELCDKHNNKKIRLTIYTDNEYIIKTMTEWIHIWKLKNWKKADGKQAKNIDLLSVIDHWIIMNKDYVVVEFKHVRSHQKQPNNKLSFEYYLWYGNNMADKLAKSLYS